LAHADEAYLVDSYLDPQAILDAARQSGAGALHPGYGFLSENAEFAALCVEAGLIFIGPPASAIQSLGSKTAARQLAIRAGAPVVPGTDGPVTNIADARRVASAIGYPVLIKAAAGGGGKGMRLVEKESELESALRDAASEAERSFRSGEVYVEKALIHPRHIEIQIFGDNHGNLIHLGERECSIQRRHQKVIEECPSPLVVHHLDMRDAMGEAALRVARSVTVGFVNHAFWKNRLDLLTRGRKAQNAVYTTTWADSRPANPVSVADFEDFCATQNIRVTRRVHLDGDWKSPCTMLPNLLAGYALYDLTK
jgi:acetyl-CoA carboxylase biotin carboxylase subunit